MRHPLPFRALLGATMFSATFLLTGGLPENAAIGSEGADALATEVARLRAYVRDNRSTDQLWLQAKEGAEPMLARAETALAKGRRPLALHRLAIARADLAAIGYVLARPPEQRSNVPDFEAEWTRMKSVLEPDRLREESNSIGPAFLRALAEAAAARVPVHFEASLEYGRATVPEYGLYYLGSARAEQEFVDFCRALTEPSAGPSPTFRALGTELDALEGDLLTAYRPPVSLDRHPEFISASGLLKEARELDSGGLRRGALLRYLQAAQRVAAIRADIPLPLDGSVSESLRRSKERLAAESIDHSLGSLLVEIGEASLEDTAAAAQIVAATIATDVLPRYFAALEPAAPPPAAAPTPAEPVTVTLVRWPYT